MILGIPYHAALAYRPEHPWAVTAGNGGLVLDIFAETIHTFRMPAFFIVAGYFAAMLLRRRSVSDWFRGRIIRLGIPLIASAILIVPAMNAITVAVGGIKSTVFLDLLDLYSYPSTVWIRHLWFLWVLIVFCAITALLCKLSYTVRIGVVSTKHQGAIIKRLSIFFLLAAVGIGLYEAVAVGVIYNNIANSSILIGLFRFREIIAEAPFFIAGYALNRAGMVRDALLVSRPSIAAFGLIGLVIAVIAAHDDNYMLSRMAAPAATLAIVQFGMWAAHGFVDPKNSTVRWLVDASFVIYIFHLPIVIVTAFLFSHLNWNGAVEVTVISFITFAMSALCASIVRKSSALNFLFNGIPKRHRCAPLSPVHL